jgi:hypothetical protein
MCVVRDAMFAELFETEIGMDGKMYMAMYVDGVMTWVCLEEDSPAKNKNKSRRKPVRKFPEIPLDCVCENDVFTGEDGKSYVAKRVNGKMCWKLYTDTPKASTVNVSVNVTVNINITL